MKTLRRALAGVVTLLALWPVTAATANSTALQCATQIVSSWSTDQLAREVVVVSVTATSTSIMTQAAQLGFGGLLVFGSTAPEDFANTLHRLPSEQPRHLAMAVMSDDEGGGVIRASNVVGTWPWPQDMARTMSAQQIRALGARVGARMAAAGLTMDLAPVADVDGRAEWPSASNPDGLRSFGGNPNVDAVDATAFAQGLASAGVVATLKHFPGLGGASANTDDAKATTQSWARLQTSALTPFRAGIASGVGAIMMANASVPGLTPLPASLSPVAVAALRHMGFSGLILTDALSAGAISFRHIGIGDAAVSAIAAGDDEVLAGTPRSPAAGLATAMTMANAISAGVGRGSISHHTLVSAAAQVVAAVNPEVCSSR